MNLLPPLSTCAQAGELLVVWGQAAAKPPAPDPSSSLLQPPSLFIPLPRSYVCGLHFSSSFWLHLPDNGCPYSAQSLRHYLLSTLKELTRPSPNSSKGLTEQLLPGGRGQGTRKLWEWMRTMPEVNSAPLTALLAPRVAMMLDSFPCPLPSSSRS